MFNQIVLINEKSAMQQRSNRSLKKEPHSINFMPQKNNFVQF